MRIIYSTLLVLIIMLASVSCNKDEDLRSPEEKELEEIQKTNELLQFNIWGFNDIIIDISSEMRAIPLLANVADENGIVQPGQYDATDIFGNSYRQENYKYQFINKAIYLDSNAQGDFLKFATYQVLRSNEITIKYDSSAPVRYSYAYFENDGLFAMTSHKLGNDKINELANKAITKAIVTGKPSDIADKVVDNILNNEEIQEIIEQLLFDIIHGKVDEITQNPDDIAQEMAEYILEKLKEVDWETLIYNKLVEILEELKIDDPELAAEELASIIADKIETTVSKEAIYEAILPILQEFEDESLPKLIPNLADAIYQLIMEKLSEENIYDKIYPHWVRFSNIDSSSIRMISDTLANILSTHFFNKDELTVKLNPFVETLRNTSAIQVPALAQDIIDSVLIPAVDSLNAYFPGLELNPDWESIKPVLTSALTIIKSSIDDKSNNEAASDLADAIIRIMEEIITKGIESSLLKLQEIPAEDASQVIAAWINNLVTIAEPDITAFLEQKLNELASLFNAEETADKLAELIHNTILDIFSYDNIYDLILPIMEGISNMNIEAIAETIIDWLSESEILEDNITEDQILEILSNIISEFIGNIDVDEASQKLTDAILTSDIVSDIDGAILQLVIKFKTFILLNDLRNDLNAIEQVQLKILRN